MKFSHKLLRSLILFSFFLLISTLGFAQVGINTTDPKAMLDIESTDSGILIPRVALSSTIVADPVTTPELSELVYNTEIAGTVPNNVTPGFYYWNGNKWVRLDTGDTGGSSDDKWDLAGNAGTDPATNFVGTTDGKALHFKTNNFSRLIIPNANQIHANHRGTVSLPFYSFAEETNTGIFSPAPKALSFSIEGSEKFRIISSSAANSYIFSYMNHRFANGAVDDPSIAFDASRKMGFYRIAANVMGFATNGAERLRVNNNGLEVNGSISLREGPALNLVNGSNLIAPVATSTFSQYRIIGPTAAFSARGITPLADADGQVITLINTTAFPLTIIHNDPSAPIDSRVFCPSESNFVLSGRYATVTLQYNKTLQKWVITESVDASSAPYGSNMQTVKGTTDTSMNSDNFTDMQDMTLTFTPKHDIVYVSFSASGYMNVSGTIPENGGAAFRLINVTASSRVEAGFATLATDYNSNGSYEAVISAWNASLNMFPVSVTPGVSTTLKIQWAREAVALAQALRCDVASDPSGAHRSLTIFD